MKQEAAWLVVALPILMAPMPLWAKESPWSASLYAGPATNNYASEIFTGKFKVEGAMVGLALDRKLVDLGPRFQIVAEGQFTHYFMTEQTSTINLGLGIKYERRTSRNVPMSASIYLGPSYAISPMAYVTPSGAARYTFLNYVSAEVAFGLSSRSPGWDLVFREYHRSGMYGLYAHDVDEGTMVGIGLRRRF